jgi:hypothetical protein
MMNTRQKMYQSNAKIRKWMIHYGIKDIFLVPHTRHSKDFYIGGQPFDGLATYKHKLIIFQNKTNKKPSKKLLAEYRRISQWYGIGVFYFNVQKGIVECYH